MVISANYSRRPITTSCASASAVVGNLDWHPSDRVQLYLRTSYSKFTDNEPRDQNRLAVTGDSSGLIGTASILVRHRKEDGNTRSASLARLNGSRIGPAGKGNRFPITVSSSTTTSIRA